MNPLVVLYWTAMKVSAVALNEPRCLFNKCGFLLTQYYGYKHTRLLLNTDQWCHLLIRWWQLLFRDVIYQSAVLFTIRGVIYQSAVLFTNPRCYLPSVVLFTIPQCYSPIRGVIYQSAGQLLIRRRRKKWLKQTLIYFLHVI